MRTFLLTLMLIGCLPMTPADAQSHASSGACVDGRCPAVGTPGAVADSTGIASNWLVDARAIARITNQRGNVRAVGSGTLVAVDAEWGLVVTCAHLFREGAGTIEVTFPSQVTYEARLAKIDTAADLAALVIRPPGIEPIKLADDFPRRGDALVSCGYGSDGKLLCNHGQALGYVTTSGGQGSETLELTGTARFGDSGGPVLNRDQQLVAVLFGTNGRVVDGTFCGRVRKFLSGLSPRRVGRPANDNAGSPAPPSSPEMHAPLAPPPSLGTAQSGELARVERLIANLAAGWQALSAKIDRLTGALEQREPSTSGGSALQPPTVELPEGVNLPGGLKPLEAAARPWLSARLAAVLVSFGLPAGVAGAVAGGAVWLMMRRGQRKLRARLDRLQTSGTPQTTTADVPTPAEPTVVERHHNRFVAYELNALDKAWAAAHAHVAEKYPGSVPYLRMAEGVKDQLLSGNNDPTV